MEEKGTKCSISLEIESYVQEFDEIRGALKRALSVEQVTKWSRIPALGSWLSLGDSIWGSVRWPKSLGKALGMSPEFGLIIQCTIVEIVEILQPPDPPKIIRLTGPGNPVSTWEIMDQDSYVVGFWTTQIPNQTHLIQVEFAPNIPWEKESGRTALGIRLIEPSSQEFEAENHSIVLPPFSIASSSFQF